MNVCYLGDEKTLFIKNLPKDSTEEMIRDFFKEYKVTEVRHPQKAKAAGPKRLVHLH